MTAPARWRAGARQLIATATALLVLSFAAAQSSAQPSEQTARQSTPGDLAIIDGVLDDGTQWAIAKPASWNGTLILDLDGAGAMVRRNRPGPQPAAVASPNANPFNGFSAWLIENGYAYGGIMREPVGYDYPKAVEHMISARAQAVEAWGEPARTLVLGSSRGAFAGRKALELRPDIFDGGLVSAGGGAGEIAVLNNKLNALFVLKTLVDPESALTLVNIDPQSENQALTALVDKAGASPEGRARLALASAVVQMATWTNARSPRPADNDYEAQLEQMRASWGFAIAIPVRAAVETIAGGNVSWNTGVDYAELLGKTGRTDMVSYFYELAGLSLADDLAELAAAPRISADAAAVARAERLMTYTGRIEDPLVNVDNDDPVDPLSDKLVYRDLLRETGSDHLFQMLWSDRPGHGGMTALDRAVGFSLLIDFLDNGEWADVSLPALRARAEAIRSSISMSRRTSRLPRAPGMPPTGAPTSHSELRLRDAPTDSYLYRHRRATVATERPRPSPIRPCHRRHAAESGPRRLAHVAAHARHLGLQPARRDRSRQRR
jgi:hypothetical protein